MCSSRGGRGARLSKKANTARSLRFRFLSLKVLLLKGGSREVSLEVEKGEGKRFFFPKCAVVAWRKN